jgi:hypothetical protein
MLAELMQNFPVWGRFEVLTTATANEAVFWDVAPCSLVEIYRRFIGAFYLHHQSLMEAQHPRRHSSSYFYLF